MLDALDSICSALARLLVAQRVPFADFAERMKGHYVHAAERVAEGKVTDSRLSLLTGLQRRDISRLRAFQPKSPKVSHEARLVALWQTEPSYQANGQPLDLPRTGDAPSFEALARSVRQDVHPRTILDTLLQAGTVRLDDSMQTVVLLEASYQPVSGSAEQLEYLGKNLGDHLSAAVENVTLDPAPHFERAVHYTGLTEAQIEALDKVFRTEQMALMKALGQKAAKMKAANADSNEVDAQMRFRAGGYFYREDQS